jgi:acyl-CoA thioesterase-1
MAIVRSPRDFPETTDDPYGVTRVPPRGSSATAPTMTARAGTASLPAMRITSLLVLSVVVLLAPHRGGATTPARALPTSGGAELVYVALGDSTVEGIGASSTEKTYPSRIAARLRQRYPNTRLVNLGVAGAVASDVVATQLERAVTARPALVTLSVGPNDVTSGVPAAAYGRHIEQILRTLQERTSAVVVLNLLPDLAITPRFASSPRSAEVGRRAVEFNVILTAAAERWNAEVVDLHRYSRSEVPAHPEYVAADGYHPSDAGYARWADVMWEAVALRLPAEN